MKRRQEDAGRGRPLIVVLATVFVIAGVAIAAYVSQQTKEKPFEPAQSLSSGQEQLATSSMPGLLLRNDSSITWVHQGGGLFERLAPSAFRTRFSDQAIWPTYGVDAALGRETIFQATEGAIPSGLFVSPDRVFSAQMLAPKADGASVIELTRHAEPPQQVVLRSKDRPLQEAQLFGWLDGHTFAVGAMGTSTRDIFAVRVDGQATRLGALPEQAFQIAVSRGMLFVITAQQGAGIELPPMGPSEVYAYTADTALGSLFQSDGVVVSFMTDPSASSPQDRFAYTTDDGQAWLMEKGKRMDLGKVRPLLFLTDGSLVFRQGFDLMVRHADTGTTSRIGALPEGDVSVYSFSPSL